MDSERILNATCAACGKRVHKQASKIPLYREVFCSHTCKGKKQHAEARARFFANVDKPNGETGCWEHRAKTRGDGYPSVRFNARGMVASRAAWIILNGPLTSKQFVCHHCDNPKCVNPSHLFIGTHQDNMRDMIAKGRQSRKLNESQLREIAASRDTTARIMQKYGISQTTVSRIRRLPAAPKEG